MKYKIKAIHKEVREGKKFWKELQFEISSLEIMNCKSIKTLIRYVKDKAVRLGIFSHAEIAQAQFDTKEVEQVWKASQEVQKSLREVLNLVLERWTLGSTHGIGIEFIRMA